MSVNLYSEHVIVFWKKESKMCDCDEKKTSAMDSIDIDRQPTGALTCT